VIDGGKTDIFENMSVELENDETDCVIVPDSLRLETSGVTSKNGYIYEFDPKNNRSITARRATTRVAWHLSEQTGYIKGTATVVANVARSIPWTKAGD
jgi:hypothetical protein